MEGVDDSAHLGTHGDIFLLMRGLMAAAYAVLHALQARNIGLEIGRLDKATMAECDFINKSRILRPPQYRSYTPSDPLRPHPIKMQLQN